MMMDRGSALGTRPRFVRMIRELVEERMSAAPNRLALGTLGPSHDVCPEDCCQYTPRRSRPTE
jgi:protoporphyrin/coproporphyrin ferrochelatase